MKRVSFKVAKAIKEAGYPQVCDEYYALFDDESNIDTWQTETICDISLGIKGDSYACPTYLEVWIWLWNETVIKIDVTTYYDSIKDYKSLATFSCHEHTYSFERDTPEEAIIAAIKYLVDNDLIK